MMFTMRERRRQATKGIMIVQFTSETAEITKDCESSVEGLSLQFKISCATFGLSKVSLLYLPAFKGLLCLDLTGTPENADVVTDFEMASVVHVTALLVDSLVDDVVGDVISSVGAFVVVVELVMWKVVDFVVVDEIVDCIAGAVVAALVVVVVSFRLQRGSL